MWLEFEGVFGITEVRVSKKFAAKHTTPTQAFPSRLLPLSMREKMKSPGIATAA